MGKLFILLCATLTFCRAILIPQGEDLDKRTDHPWTHSFEVFVDCSDSPVESPLEHKVRQLAGDDVCLYRGTSSLCILDGSLFFLTAAHVLLGARKIWVYQPGILGTPLELDASAAESYNVKFAHQFNLPTEIPSLDLAIVPCSDHVLSNFVSKPTPLHIQNIESFNLGEPVYSCGYGCAGEYDKNGMALFDIDKKNPKPLHTKLGNLGLKVIKKYEAPVGASCLLTSAPVMAKDFGVTIAGDSGAAVFDSGGSAIAVVSGVDMGSASKLFKLYSCCVKGLGWLLGGFSKHILHIHNWAYIEESWIYRKSWLVKPKVNSVHFKVLDEHAILWIQEVLKKQETIAHKQKSNRVEQKKKLRKTNKASKPKKRASIKTKKPFRANKRVR